ncbi:DUF1476 domain-containing protein, partial [Rhizobium sp. VS19-DRK62.2]|uniref:ATPase inhibitor subunit zeta n=2 Tax=Rhizobium TaxID=379 RepID=UPI001CC5235C
MIDITYSARDQGMDNIRARRNYLIAHWAAERMGMDDEAKSHYAEALRISLNRDSGFSKSRTSVSLSRGQRMRSNPGCLVAVTRDCVRLFRRRSRA